MLPLLIVAVLLTVALVLRGSRTPLERRDAALVGAAALGVRLIASAIIAVLTSGKDGVWLNDEASFYLATQSLLPNPWDQTLPLGLDHLARDGFLGLTTSLSLFVGLDATAYRFANAAIGTAVALISYWQARDYFARRPALISGLIVAVWPSLILWSVTILRDGLASLCVVVIWWALARARGRIDARLVCTVALATGIIAGLRPYLAAATVIGVAAWCVHPFASRLSRTRALAGGAAVVAVCAAVVLVQMPRLDALMHVLAYRQLTTRMETLGRLYTDDPRQVAPEDQPFKPGAAVAIVDPNSGGLLAGLVQESAAPGVLYVAFTDDSVRTIRTSDLQLLDDAPITPAFLLEGALPAFVAFVLGTSQTTDPASPLWIIDALAWDLCVVLAAIAIARTRLSTREWLFPTCILLGTIAALVAVPGSPGNADRHRIAQVLPMLVVLAAGLSGLPLRRPWLTGAVRRASSNPTSEATPATSSIRSAR